MAALTEREFEIVGDYIRDLADRMGLRDWHLFLKYEPPDDPDAAAMVVPIEGRKHATIRLAEDFRDTKPEKQREHIVHELLHLHHIPASDIIRMDLWEARVLSDGQYQQLWQSFRRMMEYCVDGLTDVFAPMFPLIPWESANGTPD